MTSLSNDQLYVSIIDHNNVIITDNNETEYKQYYIKIIIESQNYTEETLLSEIITKLNIELGNLLGYTPGEIASGNVPNFSANYNSNKKIYEIKLGDNDLVGSPTYSFKILTNQEIRNIYDIELKTCNEIIGIHKNNKTIINEIFYTGIVNINNTIDAIYLNCDELYNQDSIIVNDIKHPVIKKILIKQKNYMNNNTISEIINDYIKVSGKNIKKLHFYFTNKYGNIISFHGLNCNFTLTFNDLE